MLRFLSGNINKTLIQSGSGIAQRFSNKQLVIDDKLARRLVDAQFPQWRDLSIQPVTHQGWDNRTFRLGEQLLVRMPSDADYAEQVEKEHRWLPKLKPLLPLTIPQPLGLGEPAYGYPWKWSINRWLSGVTAASTPIVNLREFAIRLAQFLSALQRIDPTGGPLPGPHSFYRGGALTTYDTETRQAIGMLKDKIDAKLAIDVWEMALKTTWQSSPVWVHGDVSPGNLLVQDGHLSAVIDFGQLTTGDPACDLAIAWTFFKGESREVFREMLPLDADTWARGRAWALWKALIVAANFTDTNAVESAQPLRVLNEVLSEEWSNPLDSKKSKIFLTGLYNETLNRASQCEDNQNKQFDSKKTKKDR